MTAELITDGLVRLDCCFLCIGVALIYTYTLLSFTLLSREPYILQKFRNQAIIIPA